eukprot:GGOE01046655.1.p2 GENE.GGOE01046655.1~~GGOE01046655.1.p2  ORF type:complete len:104 (-),score=1.63 GGOE01046655.1:89-400(-)
MTQFICAEEVVGFSPSLPVPQWRVPDRPLQQWCSPRLPRHSAHEVSGSLQYSIAAWLYLMAESAGCFLPSQRNHGVRPRGSRRPNMMQSYCLFMDGVPVLPVQ